MRKFQELFEIAKLAFLIAVLFIFWPLTSLWKASLPPSSKWHEPYYPRAQAAKLAAGALLLYLVLAVGIWVGVWPLWMGAIAVYLYLTLLRLFVAYVYGDEDDERYANA